MSAEPVPGPDNPFDHDWHRLLRWGDIALALVLLCAPALALAGLLITLVVA